MHFLFLHTFTFQLLDKPWSQKVSSLLPPGSSLQLLSLIGFSNPTARRFYIEFCSLTLSRSKYTFSAGHYSASFPSESLYRPHATIEVVFFVFRFFCRIDGLLIPKSLEILVGLLFWMIVSSLFEAMAFSIRGNSYVFLKIRFWERS